MAWLVTCLENLKSGELRRGTGWPFEISRVGELTGPSFRPSRAKSEALKATPIGRLVFNSAIAQFEREIMLDRQREGIAKAKAAGKYKGRAPTARAKAVLKGTMVGPAPFGSPLSPRVRGETSIGSRRNARWDRFNVARVCGVRQETTRLTAERQEFAQARQEALFSQRRRNPARHRYQSRSCGRLDND